MRIVVCSATRIGVFYSRCSVMCIVVCSVMRIGVCSVIRIVVCSIPGVRRRVSSRRSVHQAGRSAVSVCSILGVR
jgi:hypothetical protein